MISWFAVINLVCVTLQMSLTILKFSLAQTGGGLFRKFDELLRLAECVLKKMASLYISGRVFGLGIHFPSYQTKLLKNFYMLVIAAPGLCSRYMF